MQIDDIQQFLAYYGKIKSRTRRLFSYIPRDKMEWTYQEGKFTVGDIIRHLGAIERYMYAENAQGRLSRYKGCGIDLADGYEEIIAYYERMHEESKAILSQLTPRDLRHKVQTPAGIEITLWKWLRAMLEHEIHHRGQLYMYLAMLRISTPPLYGLTSEEVAAVGKQR
ncbi:MAG: DinB family protein [Bacteroidota bacterium]